MLDAGAGIGSLIVALADRCCVDKSSMVTKIDADAFEIDPQLATELGATLSSCREHCAASSVKFSGNVIRQDFIEYVSNAIVANGLVQPEPLERYDIAILNHPVAGYTVNDLLV